MADESYGFTQARARLEEIVSAVRKKDTSLEKSLDLLEEGVRLANQCTELIDHADWEAAGTGQPIVPDAVIELSTASDAGEDAVAHEDGAADEPGERPGSGTDAEADVDVADA